MQMKLSFTEPSRAVLKIQNVSSYIWMNLLHNFPKKLIQKFQVDSII
jgi:hypothetical protein